jgi:hypothetical protein
MKLIAGIDQGVVRSQQRIFAGLTTVTGYIRRRGSIDGRGGGGEVRER